MSRRVATILHVTPGLGRGGAETMLYRLVTELNGRGGVRHVVVSLRDICSFDFSEAGVQVFSLGMTDAYSVVRQLPRLRKVIAAIRPDIVQGWMYLGNVVAQLATTAEVPVLWGIHSSLHDLGNENRQTRVLVKAGAYLSKVRQVRRILFCSNVSMDQHCTLGYSRSKALFVPNGFACDVFAPNDSERNAIRRELGYGTEHVVMGNFGRYFSVKNHELLLRAFSRFAGECREARLVLAGIGINGSNQELMRHINSLRIADRVTLLGEQAEMPRLYRALDFYVLSSRSEAFPNVLGEAMACGVPCITTDVGDAALIVGETGSVVPTEDVAAMVAAMTTMTERPAAEVDRIKALCRHRIVDRFSLPHVTARYTKVYESVVQ